MVINLIIDLSFLYSFSCCGSHDNLSWPFVPFALNTLCLILTAISICFVCLFCSSHLLMNTVWIKMALCYVRVFKSERVHAHGLQVMMVLICQSGMHLMHRHCIIQRGQIAILFPLHPAILNPDLNLSLCHTQGMCDFNPPTACQVPIKMKFFLQFKSLVSGI